MRTSVRSLLAGFGLLGLLAGTAACGGGDPSPAAEAAAPAKSPYKSTPLPASYRVPDVKLTGFDGKPYDLAAKAEGKVTLLFFGYTHCPDICPTTMADAAGAMSLLSPEERAKTQVVFVTADPRRDTPKALKDFLNRFDRSFVGLTGPMKDIQKAAADAKVSLTPPPANAKGDYLVSHGNNVMVYGPDGGGKLMFPYQFGSADMAKDLRTLLKREGTATPAKARIDVSDARVRVPATPDVTAGYLTIANTGAPDTLTGVSTPAAGSVEMHKMVMGHGSDHGSMKMEQMKTVPVPQGTVKFDKGGLHLMLMKPKQGLKPGDKVELTLRFAKAGDVKTTASVVPAGS